MFILMKAAELGKRDNIQKTNNTYLPHESFIIVKTADVKSISGLFGKKRESDLYFIAERKNLSSSQ